MSFKHFQEDRGQYIEGLQTESYVWYENDWKHDDNEDSHDFYQLNYVEQGYQYFHIEHKIYLVPQNNVIWIPANKKHRTTSEAKVVNPMLILFKSAPKKDFYNEVHVFEAPAVLREMMFYASKWNKARTEDHEQHFFLKALLGSLPNFCNDSFGLQVPVPRDSRLIPVCHYINANFQYNVSADDLGEIAKMSARNLQRIFKQETGITLQKYIQLIRIVKSIELIDLKRFTLSEVAYKVGYNSLSAFRNSYFAIMKTKPSGKS
ncbi:helix-turn-helix domain-containing protein [Soonwooa sp.]|uniref:helix-turn-helix domain-containing protein n=1 Tax=Soonwooa sp. TaxID=1938592 RepID=UPI0028A5BCEE|nr:helix-turn-helix domain-containing protein [Soonwooa sp.]